MFQKMRAFGCTEQSKGIKLIKQNLVQTCVQISLNTFSITNTGVFLIFHLMQASFPVILKMLYTNEETGG